MLEAPEHLTAHKSRFETLDNLFGSPVPAKHLQQVKTDIHDDKVLCSATEAYISNLSANMHDKMFQYDSWTRIEDLWSFLQLVIVRCTLETLFGSALLKTYPRAVRDYIDFASATEDFVPGLPHLMSSGAGKPRDRLHAGLMKWSAAASTGINSRNTSIRIDASADETEWNAATGLRSVREHCHGFESGDNKGMSPQAKTAEMLRILHT